MLMGDIHVSDQTENLHPCVHNTEIILEKSNNLMKKKKRMNRMGKE